MKNTISQIKNILEGITNRLDEAEDQISDLEDKGERNTKVEQLHEKRLKKYEDSLRELQDNMKHIMLIIGMPEREEKEQGIETLLEKNNGKKLSSPGEGESHKNSGSTDVPNQDESKQAYSKKHQS